MSLISQRRPVRVYAMGRVPCYCAECGGEKVWKIIYAKGETPRYEDEYGKPHKFVEAKG